MGQEVRPDLRLHPHGSEAQLCAPGAILTKATPFRLRSSEGELEGGQFVKRQLEGKLVPGRGTVPRWPIITGHTLSPPLHSQVPLTHAHLGLGHCSTWQLSQSGWPACPVTLDKAQSHRLLPGDTPFLPS